MKRIALFITILSIWANAINCLDAITGNAFIKRDFSQEFIEDSAIVVNGGQDDLWYTKFIYNYNRERTISSYDRCVGDKCWSYSRNGISHQDEGNRIINTEIYENNALVEIRKLFIEKDSVVITTYYEEEYDTTQMLIKYIRNDTLYGLNYQNNSIKKKF